MRTLRVFRIAAILIVITIHGHALAVEFVTVGPRAMGMGGAGVAVTTDALATYWNPAGLAMTQTVDIRIVGGGQAIDRAGLHDTIKDLENFDPNAPGAAAQAQNIANQLNQPGANTSLNGAAGLYVKGHFGEHAFGFNISDVATGGAFISTPVQVSVQVSGTTITGQMALKGLEQRQAAFSYAYAFAEKTFSIGITAKAIQGAAYNGTETLLGGQNVKLSGNFGKPEL